MNRFYDNNSFKPQNNFWERYDNIIDNMSNEEKKFVSNNEEVIKAKNNLIMMFIDYLFEQNKNSFIYVSEETKKLADLYLKSVKSASEKFISRADFLEKENQELKEKLNNLLKEGKHENTAATKRT